MKTVYNTIELLLKIKSPITYNEVAKVARLPVKKVITVIAANLPCLILDKKGRIVNFDYKYVSNRSLTAFNNGEYFYINDINYGASKSFSIKGTKYDYLRKPYWNGGIGDCYCTQEILVNEENEKELRKLGAISLKEWGSNAPKLDYYWIEE